MFDTKSEANEFVADTREEAITKATRFYSVDEAELIIKEPESGQIYGLGARAVVVATPKSAAGPNRSRSSEPGRDRGDRGDRGDRSRGRGRSRPSSQRGEAEGSDRDSSRKPDRERESTESPQREVSREPSKGTALGDLSDIGEYVLGVVERMAIGPFEIQESEEGEFVVLQLKGAAADGLAGGDSRAVGALQLLANQAALRADESAMRVVVDCGGDEGERESFIERQAGRAASRASDTGRSVALDPMNGRDRRALHMAVREIDGVVTMSVGTGLYRQVVIVPEGAPEYEEAEKASREAQARSAERDQRD